MLESRDLLLREKTLIKHSRVNTDVTALPAGASLITESDWAACVKAAGGEARLLAELGVVSDKRVL